jgi:hypothetical protein
MGDSQHIPLAKCRVLYLGSAVPLDTKNGLEAVQKPLRERYPLTASGEVRLYITVDSDNNNNYIGLSHIQMNTDINNKPRMVIRNKN